MPVYTWLCNACSVKTDVLRSIKDIENQPDDGCEACKSKDLKRVIAEWRREQSMLVWGGQAPWHSEAYSKTKRIRET